MSGSEMGSREPFTVGLHNHNMRLDFAAADGTPLYNNPLAPNASPTFHPSTAVTAAPININGGAAAGGESAAAVAAAQAQGHVGSSSEPKKRRGRPRKYGPGPGPDGGVALGLAPTTSPAVAVNQNQNQNPNLNQSGGGGGGVVSPGIGSATPNSNSNSVKKRGRPRGSLNKHRHMKGLGLAKLTFTPHVLTVKAGEDLSVKIMSLSTDGPRNVCILTANGTISNVTLSQPAISGGTVTYEGRFEILALCGSLVLSEDGQFHRAGGLSLTLSGPDGRVMGGAIAGVCIAASPIQVVLGSFLTQGRKGSKLANLMGNLSATPNVPTAGQSSSPSRGTLSESSGGAGSPLNQSTDACNNNNTPQGISGMPWK